MLAACVLRCGSDIGELIRTSIRWRKLLFVGHGSKLADRSKRICRGGLTHIAFCYVVLLLLATSPLNPFMIGN